MEQVLGEIRAFAYPDLPEGFLPCDGRLLDVNQNQALYYVLGNTYGGAAPATFALPDLRGRFAVGNASTGPTLGGGAPAAPRTAPSNADNSQPFLAISYGIAVNGWFPSRG